MLLKTGDKADPGNWQPIVILSAVYKVFAKILHNRLSPTLEQQQHSEQMGSRPGRSVDDALVSLKSMVGKAFNFQLDVSA